MRRLHAEQPHGHGYSARPAFRRAVLALAVSAVTTFSAAAPALANFQNFVDRLWIDAQKHGVPRQVFNEAFRGVTPDPSILAQTRKQAEFTSTSAQYISKRASDLRIEKGRAKAQELDRVLRAIEARYGVDRFIVLSVWGNETNYGGFLGGHSVIRALSTLAYGGYREAYFRKELLHALDILAQRHTDPKHMIGSWAGAMGHTQFMPSSFKAYAADFDGDGRRDIWTNIPDALASTANYLKVHGWRPGETWGYEVVLPQGFSAAQANRTASLAQWQSLGVRRANGAAFPRPSDQGRLILPGGLTGPAFVVLPNFRVIKRYNNADNYALVVGHLADRIRGAGPFVTPWPEDQLLTQKEREEIQTHLSRRGYAIGTVDGKFGPQTRTAIRQFQAAAGLEPNGNGSLAMLERLRTAY
ncbi:lytic murein transglycosylase [Terrihabitans sp. B22-R8]|uniref:lytic murein transglycosylase n=1 Tax=Terrihabitans sp. B22-R8 TaxID=3425128 RepID=UPI00403CCC49